MPPFLLGMLFVPVTLAVIVQLFRLYNGPPNFARTSGLVLTLVGVLPAIAVAHPGALMAVLVLSSPLAAVAAFAKLRQASRMGKIWRIGAFAVFLEVLIILNFQFRPTTNNNPRYSAGEAAVQTLSLGLLGHGLPLLIAAASVIGAVIAIRHRRPIELAAVGMAGVGAILYLVAAGASSWILRVFLTGVWFSDPPRLGAIYVVAVLPLAAIGAMWVINRVAMLKPNRSAAASLVVLSVVLVQLSAGWFTFVPQLRSAYAWSERAPLLSLDERDLLRQLPEIVPADSRIIGSPWTGTSLAYALAGRHVLMYHVQTQLSDEGELLMRELRWADERPEVCRAAETLGVKFVLDFGTQGVRGKSPSFPGIEHLETSSAVELVTSSGQARLYRLSAC